MLYCITILGMLSVGYQTGIAGSKRSLAWPILAVSFALVFALIASLDRPDSGIMKVPQQPLIDLRDAMEAAGDADANQETGSGDTAIYRGFTKRLAGNPPPHAMMADR